jgi:transcriptional regulatory protein GAL4
VRQYSPLSSTQLSPLTESNPTEVIEPTLHSSLIAQAKFHLAANKVFRASSVTKLSARDALALNNGTTPWTVALPRCFKLAEPPAFSWEWYLFERSRLWWKFWNLQITLTRPFLLQWVSKTTESRLQSDNDPEAKECRSICLDSAHQTIISIEEHICQTSPTRVASWHTLFVVWL